MFTLFCDILSIKREAISYFLMNSQKVRFGEVNKLPDVQQSRCFQTAVSEYSLYKQQLVGERLYIKHHQNCTIFTLISEIYLHIQQQK